MCHFAFKFVAFDFSNNNFDFDFQSLSRLISQMTLLISKIYRVWFLKWHFWFPKFVAFDFSNDTFDFQNLSRLISQITLLISEICRVWFLKYHFRFPKWDRYGWYSCDSSVGGKPYSRQGQGDTQSIVTSRPNEAESVFYWKKGMCPWIGYRVWVSSSLF